MATSVPALGAVSSISLESATVRRLARRIMPLVTAAFLVANLDRSNVAIASLTMNDDIGLTATAYGLGAGLFFVTYILAEIPSNVVMSKVGARRWLARIMVTWGIVAGAMSLVQGPGSFITLRLLLGAAEAGFTPGVVFYLSRWYPAAHRGRALGIFYVGGALATAIGAPLGGGILKMDGLAGLAGWQWLFIIEAVPAVVLGFVMLVGLTDDPDDATWLDREQRSWLTSTLRREKKAVDAQQTLTMWQALRNTGFLLLSLFLFLYSFNSIGLTLWMPQVIKGTFGEPSDTQTSLLTAIPYALAAVLMIVVSRNMDRRGRPDLHMAVPMLISGVTLFGSVIAGSSLLGFVLLAVSTGTAWSAIPALWKSATAFSTGVAAAAGVALINSVANIAGVGVTPLIGKLKSATGSFTLPLIVIAVAMLLGAVVGLLSRRHAAPGRLAASPDTATGTRPGHIACCFLFRSIRCRHECR